jgi:hypothetical protein
MDKSNKMFGTEDLQELARQGYYYIIRYPNGDELGAHRSEQAALIKALKLKRPGFQIVLIHLR